MEFRILGPLEVCTDAGAIVLGGPLPRALLAMLLLHPNQPVPTERLTGALWGEAASAGAGRTLQVYVSRLRKALDEPERLVIMPAGYLLRVLPGELDAERFERRGADGLEALATGELERAASGLREALSLWRGPALAELASVWLGPGQGGRLGGGGVGRGGGRGSGGWSRWRRGSTPSSRSGSTPIWWSSCRRWWPSTRGVSGCTRS